MLEGLKIVEYATYVAAPSAGGMMADWGADVIKIEAVSGDPIRYFFGTLGAEIDGNPVFDMDNRGKRSLALNTATPEGAEILKKLASEADVFLTNVRPGGLKRAGLDWESIKQINPKLIYASVSGYGLEGDDQDRPGLDMAAYWARSGVAHLTIPKGGEPFALRTATGDHTTGLAVVSGILAALYERDRTGKGRLVEASLLRAGIYSHSSDYAIQLRLGRVASTKTRQEMAQPLNNFFKTSDGYWLCILPRHSGDDWPLIARTVGREDLVEDERFTKPKSRKINASALIDALDDAFSKQTLDEWAKRLDEGDVIWAPVQTPAQVVKDPQAIAAGAFVDVPDHDGGTFKAPASPIRFHGADDGPKGASPHLGQHTDEILSELGLSETERNALREQKIIA